VFLSCLTHKSYNNSDEQCVCYVGLGKGLQCCDISPFLLPFPSLASLTHRQLVDDVLTTRQVLFVLYVNVKKLVKAILQHNRLLKEHITLVGYKWLAEDRQFIIGLVNKAAVFKKALNAYNISQDLFLLILN
jgi:hypothetical protein